MRAIHHVGITVRDLDVSVAFYHDLLGLPFAIAPTPWFEGPNLARGLGVESPASLRVALFEIGRGATWLEILEYRSPRSHSDRALDQNDIGAGHVAIHVDDIEATFLNLQARGIVFNSTPAFVDDGPLAGWRWVYFRDPDGHMLELVEVAYTNLDARHDDIAAYEAAHRNRSSHT